jgi:hypothetical protein
MKSLADPRELADLIALCRENLSCMGAGARLRAEGFSTERAVDEFTGLIGETET